ncbi:MAG TPA: HAD-IA family hydrolase [Propioniciclava tarda]|nr:HAD-IA family hydrolase [Propioniciclava tarda]HQD60897.1 HAD-IA family hydrolase [Propioniciclava tarda]
MRSSPSSFRRSGTPSPPTASRSRPESALHNKPDPEAFVAALSAMNARPEAVLFIDDRPTNIDAACAQGMGAHCHTTNADTIAAIERFLNQPATGPDA